MSHEPRLAVHVGRQVPDLLLQVLTAASPWCAPVAVSDHEPPPHGVVAHLYSSEVLPGRPAAPFAVWRLSDDTAPAEAAAVLSAAGDAAPGDLVVSPMPTPDGARPVLPFTRGRYRQLRGLPDRMLAVAEDDGPTWAEAGHPLRAAPPDSWPTLAALASAVVATGDHLWSALAWGAPVVTDPVSARHWGLTADATVLVAGGPFERRALAEDLSTDQTRAAVLARNGWVATQQCTPDRIAERLCQELGLTQRHDLVAPAGMTAALDRLSTPRSAFIRRRARDAAAALPGAVTLGWRSTERSLDVNT